MNGGDIRVFSVYAEHFLPGSLTGREPISVRYSDNRFVDVAEETSIGIQYAD